MKFHESHEKSLIFCVTLMERELSIVLFVPYFAMTLTAAFNVYLVRLSGTRLLWVYIYLILFTPKNLETTVLYIHVHCYILHSFKKTIVPAHGTTPELQMIQS